MMEEENTTISTSDDLAKQQEILDDNRRLQEQFKRIDEEKIQTAKGVEERAKTRQAELADPHGAKDPQDYGFGENIKELQNAFVGGGRDTISSVLTLPERATDMFRGEDVGGKEYKLDWDPLGDELNPVAKTWWVKSAVVYTLLVQQLLLWEALHCLLLPLLLEQLVL